jgi:hypothetical protein
MTLSRWLKDPALGFPQPVVIGRVHLFDLDKLDAFDKEQAEKRAFMALAERVKGMTPEMLDQVQAVLDAAELAEAAAAD